MHIRRVTVENILLIFMLAFAPLALAAVHTWAYCTLAIAALSLFSLHSLPDIERFNGTIKRPESIGALAFLFVSLFYIIPLPPAAVKLLSPHTWDLWQNYTIDPPKLMTLSLYVHATSLYILKFVTYFMVFLVVVSKIIGKSSVVSRLSSEDNSQFTIHYLHSPQDELTSSQAHKLLRHAPSPMYHAYLMLGALCAVLSILFHSLSDFNLQIPANALYFTVMLGIITGLSQSAKRIAHSRGSALSALRSADPPHDKLTSSQAHELKQGISRGSSSIQYLGSSIDQRFLSLLMNAIILISFAIAVFGIVQKLSYNGRIYWFIEKAGDHFGPYVNYDHFAGYMEICVFLSLTAFLGKISGSTLVYMRKWTEKIVWFSTKEANKTLMYLFFAVVMATSLFMTTSRGGIMSFLGALAVLYFTCLISAEPKKRNRILLASALTVILVVIMFAWVGPEETIGRFEALQVMIKAFISERAVLSEIRPDMWKDTLEMIRDFPASGVGLGVYSYVFPKYRTFDEQFGFLQFAHNDYIQFVAEMGGVAIVFLGGFLVWYVRKFRECVRGLRENG